MPAPSARSAAQATASKVTLPGEKMSLNDMLRVMDVAREIGRDRATAEKMFEQDGVRANLREKLMRSAQVSGDKVTSAEIDAAIDQYFQNLHIYTDPAPGWQSFWAHAWVWRQRIAAGFLAVVVGSVGIWMLFFSSFAPLNGEVRARRSLATQSQRAEELLTQVKAVSTDPAALDRAQSLFAQVNAATTDDVTVARRGVDELQQLHDRVLAEFDIRIVSGGGAASMLVREALNEDTNRYRLAGYYVIVEAVDAQGTILPQSIRNAETGKIEVVKRWAERVPENVYKRLADDKRSDGVLNEIAFAKKNRGQVDPAVILPDATGNPIIPTAQLTQFDVPQ